MKTRSGMFFVILGLLAAAGLLWPGLAQTLAALFHGGRAEQAALAVGAWLEAGARLGR